MIKLHCLGGRESPPEIASDLRKFSELPAEAQARIWQVLGPALAEPVALETEARLEGFCRAFALSGKDLAHAIKASRFLLREAAGIDLDGERFGLDITALVPDQPDIKSMLMAGFDQAKAQIRLEQIRGSLSDHGKLLVGVDWRIDSIQSSGRGAKLKSPVAMLTLRYKEGETTDRVTVQLLPDMIAELKRICEAMLG